MTKVAHQNQEEELLSKEVKKKLGKEPIVSIKSKAEKSGDTKIKIRTKNYEVILGANDLGVWFEGIKRKKK